MGASFWGDLVTQLRSNLFDCMQALRLPESSRQVGFAIYASYNFSWFNDLCRSSPDGSDGLRLIEWCKRRSAAEGLT